MWGWTDSTLPKSRMAWISCVGVPLRCWTEEFFRKIGWIIGEPLLVEEDTKMRYRLDRGRILVLIPHGSVCPCNIRVLGAKNSFEIKVSGDHSPISFPWLVNFLGLKMNGRNDNSNLNPSAMTHSVDDEEIGQLISDMCTDKEIEGLIFRKELASKKVSFKPDTPLGFKGKDVEGNQSSWYLEAEIAKVIEIRFTIEWLRTRFSRNEEEMSQAQIDTETTIVDTLGNQLQWCLEEEISKVIETSVTFGFNFGPNNREIVVEVSRRELEDIALFAGPDKSQ
ncbi:hypothetical protein LWI28_015022 [Acer negundo]|uniref:DUF4283 domain-containing protein n=1 Tax=Acer negundo TaxID=4023 RepID=A0AAD5P345_ACENE|nr:hypothetical protein LWI28_015022 [Acer negundo]